MRRWDTLLELWATGGRAAQVAIAISAIALVVGFLVLIGSMMTETKSSFISFVSLYFVIAGFLVLAALLTSPGTGGIVRAYIALALSAILPVAFVAIALTKSMDKDRPKRRTQGKNQKKSKRVTRSAPVAAVPVPNKTSAPPITSLTATLPKLPLAIQMNLDAAAHHITTRHYNSAIKDIGTAIDLATKEKFVPVGVDPGSVGIGDRFRKARADGHIDFATVGNLDRWWKLRNDVTHQGYIAGHSQAQEMLNGVEPIIKKLYGVP